MNKQDESKTYTIEEIEDIVNHQVERAMEEWQWEIGVDGQEALNDLATRIIDAVKGTLVDWTEFETEDLLAIRKEKMQQIDEAAVRGISDEVKHQIGLEIADIEDLIEKRSILGEDLLAEEE